MRNNNINDNYYQSFETKNQAIYDKNDIFGCFLVILFSYFDKLSSLHFIL